MVRAGYGIFTLRKIRNIRLRLGRSALAATCFLQMFQDNCSPWIDYRSDLWKHMRGPGACQLGATLLWSVAPDDRQAIAAYYQGLVASGIIHRRQNSARKTAVALTPQFCTWGSQVDRNRSGDHLDEAFLTEIYRELKASGMQAGMFSIDDKWEEAYGNLVHSQSRLPHFEQFLDQLRADGYRIGIWAALMRCERPSDIGLTMDNMLKQPDGKPFLTTILAAPRYYLLDFTQPEVERVLTSLVRQFMRRYKPDLFKFDFGYELPAVGDCRAARQELDRGTVDVEGPLHRHQGNAGRESRPGGDVLPALATVPRLF